MARKQVAVLRNCWEKKWGGSGNDCEVPFWGEENTLK